MAGNLTHRLTLLTRHLGNRPRLFEARWRAAKALGASRDPSAVRPLIAALTDRGGEPFGFDMDGYNLVRDHAARALAKIGAPSVGPLLEALAHPDSWVRAGAAMALGLIADPSSDRALSAALNDPEAGVRREVLEALSSLRTDAAIQALIEALERDEVSERTRAIDALSRTGDERAIEPLARLLEQDEEACVRMNVARVLALFPRARVEEPLARALKDEDEYVREKALYSLAALRALDAVAIALSDPRPGISVAAARMLEDTDWEPRDETARIGYLVATRQWEQAVAAGAAAVDVMASALHSVDDDFEETIAAAARALAEIGDARAVEPLLEALGGDMQRIRRAVVAALVSLGDRRAVPPFLELLAEGEQWSRVLVARALGELGDPAAIPGLVRAAVRGDDELRLASTQALARIGAAAVEPLAAEIGATPERRAVIEAAVAADAGQEEVRRLVYEIQQYRAYRNREREAGSLAPSSLESAWKEPGRPSDAHESVKRRGGGRLASASLDAPYN